jgi:aspartyl-tRNA(Asn)/glutamyl-tRNA(Gln) amidotransferase subunit A
MTLESAEDRLVHRPFDECDFTTWTAIAIAAAVNSGRVRPMEIAIAFIERLEQVNPLLNAVVAWSAEAIKTQVESLEQRLVSRKDDIPLSLAGVPVLVKDNIWVKGWKVTQGSFIFKDFVAPEDALVVTHLKASGAIILGMTNCPEFACRSITTNSVYGTTLNPWALTHTPGGSSGGSASAVAADLAPLALGTDAGGSIRRPAAHTGVIGMMPAAGTVPSANGFPELAFGTDSLGVFARSAADVRLALMVMRGQPEERSSASKKSVIQSTKKIAPLRIGYSRDLGLGLAVEPDVEAAVKGALHSLAQRGVVVVKEESPAWPPGMCEARIAVLEQTALALFYGNAHLDNPGLIDPDVAEQIENGMRARGIDVAEALVFREALSRQIGKYFQDFDLLVTPTTPCTAWPVSEEWPRLIAGHQVTARHHASFTWFVNQVQAAGCSVPCGIDKTGLPIGLQIIAPSDAEARLLDLVNMLGAEQALSLPSDLLIASWIIPTA